MLEMKKMRKYSYCYFEKTGFIILLVYDNELLFSYVILIFIVFIVNIHIT